ncbi:MAG: hypothetical protein ACE5IJ_06070 [Thermoplasmata archaeon]
MRMMTDHPNDGTQKPPVGQGGLIAFLLPEPLMEFGDNGRHVDPKFGLTLHGPYGGHSNTPRPGGGVVHLGMVGETDVLDQGLAWFDRCQTSISVSDRDAFLAPPFPGFLRAVGVTFSIPEPLRSTIPEDDVDEIEAQPIPVKRVQQGVQLYADRLRRLKEVDDPRPSAVVCALSKRMIDLCYIGRPSFLRRARPKLSATQRQLIAAIRKHRQEYQKTLGEWEPELALDQSLIDLAESMEAPRDFYRLLKAEAMTIGMPIQVAKEGTFLGGPGVEDDATRAWNLAVGLYYKTQGTPWRVRGLDPGACYVGVTFFRDRLTDAPRLRTAMAHIFTASGEGLVIRGEPFEWDRNLGATPHLTKAAASSLMTRALDLYREHAQRDPSRLIVHKTSVFWKDEIDGFQEASGGVSKKDFVAFRKRPSLQTFRLGEAPPLRGTVISVGKGRYLVFTRGYIPFLRMYPGARMPRPLEVIQHIGSSPARQVCKEILALTKMNWNSAGFCSYLPSTLAFAAKVGDILGSVPEEVIVSPYYRHYM